MLCVGTDGRADDVEGQQASLCSQLQSLHLCVCVCTRVCACTHQAIKVTKIVPAGGKKQTQQQQQVAFKSNRLLLLLLLSCRGTNQRKNEKILGKQIAGAKLAASPSPLESRKI